MKKYGNSSYWLSDWEDDDIVVSTMDTYQRKSHDIYKMASSKRAISNFVNIVTNKQIPVKFSTRNDSYTDGKFVVIGSEVIEPKDFDVAVGLALHEGSHIKLSDFQLLNDIYNLVPEYIKEGALKKGINSPVPTIKDIWNVIEDRRIDEFVFNSAPGYRDYYRAMYDKYFNDPLIDKGLKSDEFREENLESYMFRIINLHNKNTDLTALSGLPKIYQTIGLNSISRLKSSKDTFDVALDVFRIILDSLSTPTSDSQSQSSDSGSGDSESNETRQMTDDEFNDFMDSLDGNSSGKSPMSGDMDSDSMGGTTMEIELPDGVGMNGSDLSKGSSNKSDTQKVTLSDKQKELLKKKIQKQEKFLDGDISKKKITKKDEDELKAVEESDSELRSVGDGIGEGRGVVHRIQCVVAKNMTRSLMESEVFPMSDRWHLAGNTSRAPYSEEAVRTGIQIGTILGKKLQIRGENKNTIFNRQRHGKIDKRMISSLGFGNENVFQYIETDSYKKANLHISIDASGSMGGSKWDRTMTNVVALCKAVDMISNLSIQVSFRGTTDAGGIKPYIVLAYDSRKDKFSKVKQLFPYLTPGGTTPEGLCYEAIMGEFLSSGNDMDSYFLNISDGEPGFSSQSFYYSGSVASEHTRKMVKKIEAMGIKTLSYYIDEYSWGGDKPSDLFIKMYGSGARKIDVTNVSQITKTLNELFLSK
jgi:hypothetical protein